MKIAIMMLLAMSCIERTTASIIYESATLGPIGQKNGATIDDEQFLGVRFSVDSATEITSIGGHLDGQDRSPWNTGNGLIFGAIVSLDDFSDFPDSLDLSSSDLLGHVVFAPPRSSMDVDVDMSLVINPGTYGLIFGSGLFGATGEGYMALGNTVIDSPSFFFKNRIFWVKNLGSVGRFTVKGHAIPEPSTLALVGTFGAGLFFTRKRFHN